MSETGWFKKDIRNINIGLPQIQTGSCKMQLPQDWSEYLKYLIIPIVTIVVFQRLLKPKPVVKKELTEVEKLELSIKDIEFEVKNKYLELVDNYVAKLETVKELEVRERSKLKLEYGKLSEQLLRFLLKLDGLTCPSTLPQLRAYRKDVIKLCQESIKKLDTAWSPFREE